jgi:hypothetical protein
VKNLLVAATLCAGCLGCRENRRRIVLAVEEKAIAEK